MSKMIEIEDNGHVWHVPLIFVAEHRADFYEDDEYTTRQGEIDFVMEDGFEGIDWFQNNMDFSDVAHVAIKKKTPTVSEPSLDAVASIVEVDK